MRAKSGRFFSAVSGGPVPGAFWICLGLVVSVLAVYLRVLGHEFVRLDDDVYLLQNSHVSSGLSWAGLRWAFTSAYASNWHPLTWVSHMIDCELFGLRPGGPQLVNAVFHAANACLLFIALRMLAGSFWTAAFVAALFALHPLRVESVAWASERKDVLAGFFWMATLVAYARYVRPGRDSSTSRARRRLDYGLVSGSLLLGLLCKPMLVTLPLVLVLLDIWPLGRWRQLRLPNPERGPARTLAQLLIEKAPLLALVTASAVVTMLAQRTAGSVSSQELIPWAVRVANASVSSVGYLLMTVWPRGLACFYPLAATLHENPWSGLVWPAAASLLFLAAVTGASLRHARRFPYLPVGWLWFLGTLVPVSGIIQVGSQSMADRYTYIPLIGIYLVVGFAARDFVRAHPRACVALRASAVLVLVVLATVSWRQVGVWRDTISLMEHAIAVTENNYLAHNNLGLEYSERGRLDEAERHFRFAVAAKPDLAEAYCNLGLIQVERRDLEGAGFEFELAVRQDPGLGEGWTNLGRVRDLEGKSREAIGHYRRALRTANPPVLAARNLAWILSTADELKLRDGAEAIRWAQYYAESVGPGRSDPLLVLAAAQAQAGDFASAVRSQEEALAQAPADQVATVREHLEQYRAGVSYR